MTLPAALKSCDTRRGANASDLTNVEAQLGRPLPPDYKEVLTESDGLEGFVCEDQYVSLWSTSDLPSLNDAYAVSEFVPGVILIGSDGGELGYGFRMTGGAFEYVAVPLVGMRPDALSPIGRSFSEVLEYLCRS